jgi:putative ABC transport system substrate-binding protein
MNIPRRDFITLLGGTVAWPLAARAQQRERMRRIGILLANAADDPQGPSRLAAFLGRLQELGWTVGRNLRVDYRWIAGDSARYRQYAAELVALAPDVLLCSGGSSLGALQQETHSLPIVFVGVVDPVNAGRVASLARPGGNATGFTGIEFSISGKWLQLLKEIAPRVSRAAVIRDPAAVGAVGQIGAMQAVAPSLGVELRPLGVRNAEEIEQSINQFARDPNGGLIVPASALAAAHRELIVTTVARNRLPTVYANRSYVDIGGLVSYGVVDTEQYWLAAGYVDRILKGEKPADLPVQAPTKYELAINLKTAKALGLTVPDTLLAIADEVIE